MRFPPVPTLVLAACAVAAITVTLRTGDGFAVGQGLNAKAATGVGSTMIPCSAASADWVAALVDPARVAAVPEQVEKYSVMRLDAETWKDQPRFYKVDAENVLAYAPDLVMVSPFTNPSTVERMREVGLRVLVVKEPSTWPELIASGDAVAAATGTEDRWAGFRAELEARKEALEANADANPLRIMPYGNYGADSYTSGAHSTVDLALSLAGLRNHARDLGLESSASVAAETLLASPFDAFLVSGSETKSQSASALRGNALLRDLTAVAEERMIYLEDALYASGSFTILDAAERIAADAARWKRGSDQPAAPPK